jgi:hypothetical protein
MSSTFLRELVRTMKEDGDTVAILAVAGKRKPVIVEFVPRPDSEIAHGQFRLLDQAIAQQPHATN